MMHAVSGELSFQRYGKDDSEFINSMSRGGINQMLMDHAEAAHAEGAGGQVRIHFQHRLLDYDFARREARFRDEATGGETVVPAPVVLGSDGTASALRGGAGAPGGGGVPAGRAGQRLQGIDAAGGGGRQRQGRGRALRPGAERAAHLAARQLHADRAAEPGRQLHLHALPRLRGAGGTAVLRAADGRGGVASLLRALLPRRRPAHPQPGRSLPGSAAGPDGDGEGVAVEPRRGGAAGRRGARASSPSSARG